MAIRSSGRTFRSVLLAATLLLLLGAPAAAAPSGTPYTWNDSGRYRCGGSWIDWTAGGSGVISLRAGTGSDTGVYFARDDYTWGALDVRRSDGKSLVTAGQGMSKDTKATLVSGTVYELTTKEVAQVVLTDASGNVIGRDRGSVSRTILFDTLGDGDPGGDELDIISVSVHGPHPSQSFDSCAYFG